MTEHFGDYELHRRIGGGGMADVWAAKRRTASGEMACALKVIRDPAHGHERYHELFLREGEVAMKLQHGNVVSVFDVGEHDGRLYIAMELVDGVSLDRFLGLARARDPLRPNLAEAVYITREILRALHYVHGFEINEVNQRIVHRDVSPQNVLVTSGGEIKLTDFGIARWLDGHTTNRIYGKLAYMPREQYMGSPVQQSDLYAAGAIFYEALTGRKLRAACRSEHEYHAAIMSGELPPLPKRLPSVVYETLTGLLEADPVKRLPSAKIALRALGNFVTGAGDVQLDVEELYLASVDSRHSWYTELTAQAQPPTDSPRRPADKTKSRARPRKKAAARPEVDSGPAPQARPWEQGQLHDAAIDDVTTVPWRRTLGSEDAGAVQP